jgi:hypothetical protein
MKKLIAGMLCLALLCTQIPLNSVCNEDIQILAKETDTLYRTGCGARDGAYTSLSTSMIAWGICLGIGIAVLCAVVHSSRAPK